MARYGGPFLLEDHMLDALLDPAFTGADLALCLIAITAAALGARHDRKRNAR